MTILKSHTALALTLSAVALLAHAPARADLTADILGQPSTVTEPGRRSDPIPDPVIVQPAPVQPAPAQPAAQPIAAPVAFKGPVAKPILDEKDTQGQDAAPVVVAKTEPEFVKPEPVKPAKATPAKASAKEAKATDAPAPEPASVAPVAPGQGTTVADILAAAYVDSPALRAEREVLRQQYENVALAESNRRPIVTANGGIAWSRADSNPGGEDNLFGRDVALNAQQYLYRGGRTLAQIEQQLGLSEASLAAYDTATQNVFLNVITAAMDIQRNRATIDLTQQNRAVIERQMQTASRAFEVGESTRTDVAQSQARLSDADAQLIAARAAFSSAVARYRQFAGGEGTDLVVASDPKTLTLPKTLEEAQSVAESANPQIRTAVEAEKAAQSAIRAAQGELLPEISAQGSVGKTYEPSSMVDDVSSASVGIRATMPLYEAGATRARVRQAKYAQREQRDRIADAKRAVAQTVSTAWNDYNASLAAIDARRQQVEAAELARNGVYKEREVGTRTVLDTLDADAELLDAQVGEVQARRDAVVAAYSLLAATGQLTAENLGLFSADAERAKMKAAQHKWLGTDIAAED